MSDLPNLPPPPTHAHPTYPLWVRFGHALNGIVLVVLIMSGLQIFNSHPTLYAADASDANRIVLSLTDSAGQNADGSERYQMVVLGRPIPVGKDTWGSIPTAFTLGGWLAGARRLHFTVALFFMANGLIYLLLMLRTRRWRAIWPGRLDLAKLPAALRDHLRFPPRLAGEGGGLNPMQKMAYAAVPLLLAPFLVATGLALSPQWDAIFPFWTDLFGGRQFARTWHFVAMAGLLSFIAMHLFMVFLSGPRTLLHMITGQVRPVGQP